MVPFTYLCALSLPNVRPLIIQTKKDGTFTDPTRPAPRPRPIEHMKISRAMGFTSICSLPLITSSMFLATPPALGAKKLVNES